MQSQACLGYAEAMVLFGQSPMIASFKNVRGFCFRRLPPHVVVPNESFTANGVDSFAEVSGVSANGVEIFAEVSGAGANGVEIFAEVSGAGANGVEDDTDPTPAPPLHGRGVPCGSGVGLWLHGCHVALVVLLAVLAALLILLFGLVEVLLHVLRHLLHGLVGADHEQGVDVLDDLGQQLLALQIGRASCRERV